MLKWLATDGSIICKTLWLLKPMKQPIKVYHESNGIVYKRQRNLDVTMVDELVFHLFFNMQLLAATLQNNSAEAS